MRNELILVVEDDAIIAMRLEETLEAWGYRTAWAASGESALEMVEEMNPGLVLMDINLDGQIDGIETAIRMRQNGFPTIFLTAYADDELLERAKTAEPYGYLVKPVYDRELRSTVEMALYKHSADHQLRDSERRFRAIFQQAGIGVTLVDSISGRLAAGNAKFWQVIGRDPSTTERNLTWRDVTHPEDIPVEEEHLERLWRGEINEFSMEKRYLRANGDVVWVNLTISAMWESGERPSQHIAVVEDISGRKKADAALALRIKELEAVNRISNALRAAESIQQVLPLLLDQMLETLDVKDGSIVIYNTARTGIEFVETRGLLKETCADAIQKDQALIALAMQQAEKVRIDALSKDSRAVPVCLQNAPDGWSAAILPIRTTDDVLGLVIIAAPADKLPPDALRLLETIVEIAGSAIHRMRLFDQTSRSLKRIEALHRIDNAIRSNLDGAGTLNVILENVVRQLGVDAADILLVGRDANMLIPSASIGFHQPIGDEQFVFIGDGLAGSAAAKQMHVWGAAASFDRETPWRARLLREEEFVRSLSVPLVSKGEMKGVLEVFGRSEMDLDADKIAFMDILAGQTAVAVEGLQLVESLRHTNRELNTAYHETIEGWSRAMDLRDRDTEGHTQRVTGLTMALAVRMGIPDERMADIRRGALLHDIGKIGVPDEILLKPGELTPDEWVIMRSHPSLAYELLSHIEFLRPALDIPYAHHERWDGSGYPRGLKGEEIPLAARMFAVVDVYDALVSDRPYRSAWSEEQALDYIRAGSGTHFDPQVVEVFLEMLRSEDMHTEFIQQPSGG